MNHELLKKEEYVKRIRRLGFLLRDPLESQRFYNLQKVLKELKTSLVSGLDLRRRRMKESSRRWKKNWIEVNVLE
jgi:hypothetical protein